MKNTPTPFERIRRTVRATASRKASEASSKSRWASSKKKTRTGFSGSPTSGSSSKSSASTHMRKVEKSAGRSPMSARSSTETMPRPSGAVRMRSAISISGSPKKASPPSASSRETWRRRTPAVAVEIPPIAFSSALPGPGEVGERGAQVLEVDQRQALLVAEAEDQEEARLLGLVQPQHLGQQGRPEGGDRRPQGHAVRAGQRQELDRAARGRPLVGELARARGHALARLARRADPGQVALHVGREDRAAGGGGLLGDELEGARLAGAGRARDQAVAVEEPERQRDVDRRVRRARRPGRPSAGRCGSAGRRTRSPPPSARGTPPSRGDDDLVAARARRDPRPRLGGVGQRHAHEVHRHGAAHGGVGQAAVGAGDVLRAPR